MGSSGCTLLSNAFVEIRDARCREAFRHRTFLLSLIVALAAVLAVQCMYISSGVVDAVCLAGMGLCSASCLVMMKEDAGLSNVCLAVTAFGALLTVLPFM